MKIYNKKKIKFILLVALIFSMGIAMINIKNTKAHENKIKSCGNYIIYYGYKFNNTVINKLKTYDLVVINPMEEEANYVREKLQDQGIKVYGYISSVEISKYDSEFIDLIDDSEKLKVNNKVIKYWEDNELGDFRVKSYRSKIIELIGSRIVDNGFDGVFIDTIDDLDNIDYILKANNVTVPNKNAFKNEMVNAGVDFFEELRDEYSEIGIIQNRGFQVLNRGSKAFVNAILYEDIRKSSDVVFFNSVKSMLDEFTEDYNGVVMALPNSKKYYDESRIIAEENKWLYYETTNYESTAIEDGSKYRINIDVDDNDEEVEIPNNKPDNDNSITEDKDESSSDSNIDDSGNKDNSGSSDTDSNDKEIDDSNSQDKDKEEKVEDTMTEKERIVAEKTAITKVKANLSPITRERVCKDITDDELISMLLQGVQDQIINVSIEDIVEKEVSRSFKIYVRRYVDDLTITIISAKIIYE